MISVWVIDDHSVIRKGIKQILLDQKSQYEVTAEAGSVFELFTLLGENLPPEILILDHSMPGKSGLEAMESIKEKAPDLPILILSIHPEDQFALRFLNAGAAGYLSKECAPEQLVQALDALVEGKTYITNRIASLLASNPKNKSVDKLAHAELSDREFQILLLIAEGESLTNIGKKIDLSVKTISTYRARILNKLSLDSNSELVQYAIKYNLLSSAL